jgi:hypothetical protein
MIITESGIWHKGAKFDKTPLDTNSESVQKQIEAVKSWATANCQTSRCVNKKYSSYTLKDKVEKGSGLYITNGAFITAMIGLGYKAEPCEPSSPNAYFAAKYA